ncbi:MAG: hypothetical protein V1765_01650 [bacterium]
MQTDFSAGDYSVMGIMRHNGCTEYWLKHLIDQTTYIYKDYLKVLKHQTIIVGTKLKIELFPSLDAIKNIIVLNQPYNLPKNRGK